VSGGLWKISVDFFSIEASYESYVVALNDYPDPIISNPDAVVVVPSLELLQTCDILQVLSLFDMLDSVLDALQCTLISDTL
jgi:hypothetical protein